MSPYGNVMETLLETEEFVTAEEFLRRRERGEVNPADVRYSMPTMGGTDFGGFLIKLKQPRYKVVFENKSIFGGEQ